MSAPTTEIATTAKSLLHAMSNCNSVEFMPLLVGWYFGLTSESIRFFRLELSEPMAGLCSNLSRNPAAKERPKKQEAHASVSHDLGTGSREGLFDRITT